VQDQAVSGNSGVAGSAAEMNVSVFTHANRTRR
jgi:hypothetical protein